MVRVPDLPTADGHPAKAGAARDDQADHPRTETLAAADGNETVTITVRFTPDGEPEVFTDDPLSTWIIQAALYRAAENMEYVEDDSTEEEDE